MTDRPGRPTLPRAKRPSPVDEATTRPAGQAVNGESQVDIAAELTGPTPVPAITRSGDDTRRRGWFWHWNSIVTQYAPLIGLKGVGLLNSYTVWTDRREESPHRGYAFPSQQSEADFYGEDRAELITINKILVALDLIEIRKEMVLRVDGDGRRWRVPHNFYRVKDHGDGAGLTRNDVLRVAELADRDQAVYRYVRRVFSPKFAPIDRENVWARILEEVRQTDVWQRLSERTAHDEHRASARTRAGHAARKGLSAPSTRDTATTAATLNDSVADTTNNGSATSVGLFNNGLEPDVGESNSGFEAGSTTSVAPVNTTPASDVAPTNRTYNESRLTTTTTENLGENSERSLEPGVIDRAQRASQRPVTSPENVVTGPPQAHGLPAEAPEDAPGVAAATRSFEEANARGSTPAERRMLRELAERFDPLAREAGLASGWAVVARAIDEAVDSGSAYVAPRRIREILARWERDGVPALPDAASERAHGGTTSLAGIDLANVPDLPLPGGMSARSVWAGTVELLGEVLEPQTVRDLLSGTGIAGRRNDEVVLHCPDVRRAERLLGEYRDLVERKLSEVMRRPVRIVVPGHAAPGSTSPRPVAASPKPAASGQPAPAAFLVPECGLPSAQVWAAVLDELVRSGGVSRVDAAAWFAATHLLGRGEGESLIIGVAHPLAQRRIATRFGSTLRTAIAAVLGVERPVEIVVESEWHEQPRDATGSNAEVA